MLRLEFHHPSCRRSRPGNSPRVRRSRESDSRDSSPPSNRRDLRIRQIRTDDRARVAEQREWPFSPRRVHVQHEWLQGNGRPGRLWRGNHVEVRIRPRRERDPHHRPSPQRHTVSVQRDGSTRERRVQSGVRRGAIQNGLLLRREQSARPRRRREQGCRRDPRRQPLAHDHHRSGHPQSYARRELRNRLIRRPRLPTHELGLAAE